MKVLNRLRSLALAASVAFASLFTGLAGIASAPATVPAVTAAVVAVSLASAPDQAQAQQYSNLYENLRIDADVRGQTFTLPSTLYIALETASGSDAGCGTEANWTSYARMFYASSLTNWSGTQSAGSTTASTGTGGQTSNNVAITAATPGSGPTTVTGFCVMNGGLTTLSAAISTTGATSMTVTSAAQFPSSGNYHVLIDSEIVLVTAGQGTTTWTISRGQMGTTAATHSNGATVGGVMLWRNTLTSSKTINSGDTVQFPIGSLTYTVD